MIILNDYLNDYTTCYNSMIILSDYLNDALNEYTQ